MSAREQRLLKAAIQARLVHQPITETNAIKRLRPNPLAAFELRVHDLRVSYNVEELEVILLVVVELPDHRMVAIQAVDAAEDDSLIDDLLANNPEFRNLVEKSKASPRKAFNG